ncbi:glycoside hydrolase family 30 protein [Pedobacter alpinus]|uniref:Glycoside hydrolase family 30 beta sandwich domain-containing protein n=1 Tax=Pedobacter alpinus TaxID=1590643 RepID=A0ABW5TVK6_9SPHI
MLKSKFLLFCLSLLICISACKDKKTVTPEIVVPPTPPTSQKSDVECWLTNADQSALFQQQNVSLFFKSEQNNNSTIVVDTSTTYQTIDGFGYTLTDGSASLMNALSADKKSAILEQLFATDKTNIGVSYLRISIGASDLSASPYTFNDMPTGQTDVNLENFNMDKAMQDLVPILKKIIAIYPDIKILGSPWTAPAWMKTNNSFVGGSLKPEYYQVYANYLVKFIKAMKQEGIVIDAITPQNEPLHGGNNPSMVMQASEQASFIKNALGPIFKQEGLNTKIIIWDHNADRPEYPLEILNDPEARPYVNGSAFHLYGGSISALSQVRDAYPDKGIYFTEQWIGGPGNFAGDLKWHIETLIIGATRNWSRNVLEWNLAADENYQPHTDGGCSTCLGAITVNSTVKKNTAYYIIAHASKFVRPGSVRIASNQMTDLPNVAFKTPDGKKVLIVLNKSGINQNFNIKFKDKAVSTSLKVGSVATYVW